MKLNERFTETFIFHVKTDIFKVVINFTKEMYTVYTPNGRILLREKKVSQKELLELKKKISDYIKNEKELRGFSNGRLHWGFMI